MNQRNIKNGDFLELIEPDMSYADDIWDFRDEIFKFDANDDDRFAGCLSLDECGSAEEWIKPCQLRKNADTCGQTGTDVPSTFYLAVRKSDDRIVGIIDLRHHIDHPILGTLGGRCGYSVRPSERRHGYAKRMLGLNLQKDKELGINRFLVTCDEDNVASEKVVLATGGAYEKSIDDDGHKIKRYRIDII